MRKYPRLEAVPLWRLSLLALAIMLAPGAYAQTVDVNKELSATNPDVNFGTTPPTVLTGAEFQYVISYSCTGGSGNPCQDLVVTDTLDAPLEFGGTVSGAGVQSFNFSGNVLTVNLADINEGDSTNFVVTARYPHGSTLDGTQAGNVAVINSSNAGTDTSPTVTIEAEATAIPIRIDKRFSKGGFFTTRNLYTTTETSDIIRFELDMDSGCGRLNYENVILTEDFGAAVTGSPNGQPWVPSAAVLALAGSNWDAVNRIYTYDFSFYATDVTALQAIDSRNPSNPSFDYNPNTCSGRFNQYFYFEFDLDQQFVTDENLEGVNLTNAGCIEGNGIGDAGNTLATCDNDFYRIDQPFGGGSGFKQAIPDEILAGDDGASVYWRAGATNTGNIANDIWMLDNGMPLNDYNATGIDFSSVNTSNCSSIEVYYQTNLTYDIGDADYPNLVFDAADLPPPGGTASPTDWIHATTRPDCGNGVGSDYSFSLPAGQYVTAVLAIARDAGPSLGFSVRIEGEFVDPPRDGSPSLVDGDFLRNYSDAGYFDLNDPTNAIMTDRDVDSVAIVGVEYNIQVLKSVLSEQPSYNTGDTLTYSVGASFGSYTARPNSVVIADLLPVGIDYIGNVSYAGFADDLIAANGPPTFEQIADYMGTGRTLVRWTFLNTKAFFDSIGCSSCASFIRFDGMVNAQAPGGPNAVNNEVYAGSVEQDETTNSCSFSATINPDTLDFDGDGNTTEIVCANNEAITVLISTGVSLGKQVQGDLDAGFSASGHTSNGGSGTYRLTINNDSNIPVYDVVAVDILPWVGDTRVTDPSVNRNSNFQVSLGALIDESAFPDGSYVEYSDSNNPCRTQLRPTGNTDDPWPVGCTDDWTRTPDVLGDVRGVRIVLTDRSEPDYTADWPALSSLNVDIPFSVPSFPVGDPILLSCSNAYNSSGMTAIDSVNATRLLPVENNGGEIALDLCETLDYGDAPDSYSTSSGSGGAAHTLINFDDVSQTADLMLGASVDRDDDGVPSASADGDDSDNTDDENGTTFAAIGPGNAPGAGVTYSYTLNVDVNNSIGSDAVLAGWIDLNCDGVFSDTERAVGCFNDAATQGNCTPSDSRGALIATGTTPTSGKGVLYWDGGNAGTPLMSQTLVDASCPTDGGGNPITYARIRVSTDPSFLSFSTPSPTGAVIDGELEDYMILLDAATTPAVIAEVKAEAHGEAGTVVSWLSASERAASAFRLERWVESDAGNGHWQRVHDSPWIPALVTTQGGTYKVLDSPVEAGASQRYRIVERTQGGGHQSYGPFAVTAESVNAELPPLLGDFAAEARWDYDRIVAVTEARERSLKRKSPGAAALQRSDGGAKLQSEAPVRPKQLKLWVQDSGLYSLSLDQLVNAFGYSKGTLRYWLRKGRLSLQTGGEAVAYYVDDAYSLHFYGEAIDSLYTEERPYILTRQQSGLKMGALEVAKGKAVNEKFIDTTHLEEDAFAILSATTDPLADYWYMDSVATVNGFRSQSYEIAVPGARQSKGELRARVWSDFDGEHRVAVSANGGPIGELAFSGRGNQEVKLKLPKTVFSTETLQLELTLEDSPSDGFDVVFLDSLDVQYKRLSKADQGFLSYPAEADTRVMGFATAEIQTLDISNPKQPLWISGGKVWQRKAGDYAFRGILPAGDYHSTERRLSARVEGIAGSKLKARNNRADYVVISNGELMDAAEALAAYRSDKSFKTMVVEIDDIYNEFGHGIPDPAAIRSFIQASRRWKQAPAYVTLLGDGSFDYTNRLGTGYNLISPLMWPGVNGLFASDTLLGDVNGDGRPEVAVGRIPAKTLDAALAYIDKVRAYEADSAAYPALLLSDNADKGGDFLQSSNDIASRVAGSQLQLSLQGADLNQARDDLLAYLDGGVRLINYVGHGGVDRMSSEGWLLNTDADTMSNPITPGFVALTCIINNFAVAGYDSMAERMLMNPNGGVVTAWSASGESYNDAATVLGVEFHHHYSNSSRLGDAIIAALAEEQYLTSVYTLLGDPALEIPIQ